MRRVANGHHSDTLKRISEDAQRKGAVHHHFAEDTDGTAIVIDEWDSEEAFHKFFDAQEEIKVIVAEMGITGQPTSTAYQIIDTPDRF